MARIRAKKDVTNDLRIRIDAAQATIAELQQKLQLRRVA